MDNKKYYTEFQNGKGYLETFQDLLRYSYQRKLVDPFINLKYSYYEFSQQVLAQLNCLINDLEIDVKSSRFRENQDLRSLVAEMVLSLSLAKFSDLDVPLKSMNFSDNFSKFFLDLNQLCDRSFYIFLNYETDKLENIFFNDFVAINQVQIKIALEFEFGFYDEKTNSPHSKIELKNLTRRIDYALENGKSLDNLDSYERLFSGENRDIWKNFAFGMYRRNDAGSQNLSSLAGMSFSLLKVLNSEAAEHKIMLDIYDVFEVIYSYKGLSAVPDEEDDKFLDTPEDPRSKYIYDYKMDAVRSILGLT